AEPTRVVPVPQHRLVEELEVGGGDPEPAAPALPLHHDAVDEEPAAQEVAGGVDRAARQRLPDPGPADRAAEGDHRAQAVDPEDQLVTQPPQGREVAGASPAEAEAGPDHDHPRPQGALQNLTGKLLRLLTGQLDRE